MKINWNLVPTFVINTEQMSSPAEITKEFIDRKVDKYCYGISYDQKVIKYGMSCPKHPIMLGERVYRQVAHSKTWGKNRIKGSSGSEWLVMAEEFEARYGKSIGHDLAIKIWDFTNYPFLSIHPKNEINAAEAELITAHRDFFKELPIGNLNDEEDAKSMPYIPQQIVSRLFY